MPPCVLTEEDGHDGLSPHPRVSSPLTPGQRVQVSFRPEPRRVAEMRRMAATALDCAGLLDPDAAGAVELVVSELVTNAVSHGRGRAGLLLTGLRRRRHGTHRGGRPLPRRPDGPAPRAGRRGRARNAAGQRVGRRLGHHSAADR
ncbi:ATP-binding protein [Streptomyces sp. NPDC047097]|uniref:ATP-binding protein n=1 Tax=Streptomyces sp. NPDC047097 TaxID=3155260 RepID=UPI00340FF3B1